jgi:hypothetical protein
MPVNFQSKWFQSYCRAILEIEPTKARLYIRDAFIEINERRGSPALNQAEREALSIAMRNLNQILKIGQGLVAVLGPLAAANPQVWPCPWRILTLRQHGRRTILEASHNEDTMEPQVTVRTHNPEPGSPYCCDPNCPYCKELRETQELVRTGRPVPQVIKRSA